MENADRVQTASHREAFDELQQAHGRLEAELKGMIHTRIRSVYGPVYDLVFGLVGLRDEYRNSGSQNRTTEAALTALRRRVEV